MAKVTMPQLGESVAEGTIGKWLKKPGDHVAKYEPLLEVITDKVNAEVPSPVEGTLTQILVEEGATVPNNAEIAIIETADEAAAGPAQASAPTTSNGAAASPAAAADAASPTANTSAAAAAAPAAAAPTTAAAPAAIASPAITSTPAPAATPAFGPAGSDERPERADQAAAIATVDEGSLPGDPDARMTPAVRRLLREHGLTAAMIVGTGGGSRITRDDVSNYVETQRTKTSVGGQIVGGAAGAATAPGAAGSGATGPAATTPAPARAPAGNGPAPRSAAPAPATTSKIGFPEGADEVLLPMTQMRKGIAAQMTRSLAIPHAYVHMEVDVSGLVKLRESAKREYQAANGLSLSYVPFVVKAAVEALRRNGTFNANWTDAGLLAKRRFNIGVAVAVDDGLIVPVIRDADQLSIHGINQAIADVAGRARANRLRLDDFGGGTFTIDNTGWLGSNLTMPIINSPEVGILTMEAITKRAVVLETPSGDVIGIRPVMNVVLGLDHRANDGAGGAALLRDIKAWLEAVGPETAIY